MARYRVVVVVTDKSLPVVRKKLREMFKDGTAEAEVVDLSKVKTATSRADRLSEAVNDIGNAKSVVEELKDEMENWRENLPENLQDGAKADELQEAEDALEEVVNSLDEAESNADNVSFPGMF
jgi:flagellar biosynthesis chaperone FliJ